MVSLLTVIIIIYTFVIELSEKKRSRTLAKIKEELEKLALLKPGAVRKACPVFIGKFTAQQFVDIEKEYQSILPKRLKRYIEGCFAVSSRTPSIEYIAEKSKNKRRRIEAILCLGCARSPHAFGILKRSLLDKDEDVAYFSMLALGQIKNSQSAKILLDFLGKHVFSGYKIASLLESFPSSAVDEIAKTTESGDPVVRFWSTKLLGKFKAGRYIERIGNLTKDESADVRAAACESLGELRNKESRDFLLDCLHDKTWFVRMHAVRALSKVIDEECIPEVIGLIKDSSWLVKESVKDAIIGHIENAIPHLKHYLSSGDDITKRYCIDALVDSGYVRKILNNILLENAEARREATHLLEIMIKTGIYFGLKKVLDDFSYDSRRKILEVIADIDKTFEKKINQ